jgi:hypothetical protein
MSTQINISTGGSGGVTSVDLTMPSAFNVAGNPIISAGTLAVTGAGSASEYIRGDGTLANFPNSTGGGASVNYYLNGGTTVATISGVTYYELNKLAAVGTPTNFNVASNDYIASFLTNPTDPNKLLIPAGNWNFALYFSASTNAGSPNFYVELYKYDGTTFTLIADTSASPKDITSGTTKDLYTTIMAVPQTTLTLTDRLAVRVYVNNSGNTITLHTQGDNLCQIVTTFTTGLTALNGLTDQVQFFGVSTASPIGITSAGNTHTLNIPDASQTVRGVVSTGTQTFAGSKTFSSTPTFGTMTPGSVLFAGPSGVLSQDNPNLFWDDTNNRLGIGTAAPTQKLHVNESVNGETRIQISNDNTGTSASSIIMSRTSGNRYLASLQYGANKSGNYAGITAANLSVLESGSTSSGLVINASNSTSGTSFIAFATANTEKVRIDNIGNIRLSTGSDKFVRIGSSTNYWYDLQCTGDTFQIIDGGGIPRLHISYPNGNVGIGTTTPGSRLDIRALNAVPGDLALKVRDSTNVKDIFSVSNTGILRVANPTFTGELQVNFSANNVLRFFHSGVGQFMTVGGGNTVNFEGQAIQALLRGGQFGSNQPGVPVALNISVLPALSSGATTLDALRINPAINNTGTYSGIVRGIYYNPTLTSLTGTTHRAIETTTGDVIFGSTSGSVSIGSTTINSSAQLQMTSTTKGFLPPRMTTVQRTAIVAPAAGLIVYDTTVNKHYGYDGTNWNVFY